MPNLQIKTRSVFNEISRQSNSDTPAFKLVMAQANRKLLVAAIDFGTSFSGYAFSFRHEYESDPTKSTGKVWYSKTGLLTSMQAPTCILLKPDKTFHSFGYDAENKYSNLAEDGDHVKWYFFKHFKMNLHGETGISREMLLEDATGKSLPAHLIFSLAIKFLKDDLIEECKKKVTNIGKDDILWVPTMPAIWSYAAKQFMREAAIEGGIENDALQIALEPEAASIYCRHIKLDRKKDPSDAAVLQSFTPGTKYIVLDAGGGTVDITVHEINSDYLLKEIRAANGGPWGGTMVDKEFRKHLIKILGSTVMDEFMKEYMDDYLELTREFELKKREVKPDSDDKVTFRVPSTLRQVFEKETGKDIEKAIEQMNIMGKVKWRRDKLQLDSEIMKGFFETPIKHIIRHLHKLFQEEDMDNISSILMVGGFSESALLQSAIKTEFKSIKTIIPQDAGAAVLKGAVIFGHNPSSVVERKCKYTYGIEIGDFFKEGTHKESLSYVDDTGVKRCKDCFGKHVEIAQTLQIGQWQNEQIYNSSDSTVMEEPIQIYASTNKNPLYVTDQGCVKLGMLRLPLPAATGGEIRKVSVQMCYSGTELAVRATSKKNGETIEGSFDFLN